jgi:hypothetical protein
VLFFNNDFVTIPFYLIIKRGFTVMGLTFPLNSSQAGNVAQNNLSILLCAKKTGEEVTNEAVRNAFKAYQNSKIGWGHYVKKFAVSVAAYGTAIGLPVGAVAGTTYWFFKDYVKDYLEKPFWAPLKIVRDVGSAALNNQPAFDPATPIIGGLAPYTTPSFCLGTLAGIAVVDKVLNDNYGIAPARSVAKWTVNMMSTVVLYAAYKAGELAGSSYLQDEEEKTELRKYSHQKIIEQLKTIYDHVADGFFSDFEKVSESPREMICFRHMAEQLEENVPYIKSKLEELELKPFEIDQVMNKLSMAVATIKESALGFRQSGTEAGHRFNIELIKTLSKREISSIALPNDVKNHIKIANANELGVMHSIEAGISASAMGLATALAVDFAAVGALTLGLQGMGTSVSREMQQIVAVLACVPSLYAGAKIAQKVYNNSREVLVKAKSRRDEQVAAAREKLLVVYNGMASFLTKQSTDYKHNPFALELLSEDARNVLAKLPLLEKEINKLDVMRDRYDITNNLRQILVEVI